MAKAHSFIVKVWTPMASAASSSSRMADHARPTRDWRQADDHDTVSAIAASVR